MSTSVPTTRINEARARLVSFTERLVLENIAADYRRGRDPSANVSQLLELHQIKSKFGIPPLKFG